MGQRSQKVAVATAKPSRIGKAYAVTYAKVQVKKSKVKVAAKPQNQANRLGSKAGRTRIHAAFNRMCG